MVPKNEKQNNMARVQYTYTIAYVYHSMSFCKCMGPPQWGTPADVKLQNISALVCM